MSLSKIYSKNDEFTVSSIEASNIDPDLGEFNKAYQATKASPSGNGQSPPLSAANAAFSNGKDSIEKIKTESFNRGKQEGLKLAEKQFHETINALASALEDISRMRNSILTNSARDMLHLVMTITQQVIKAELTLNDEIILKTITTALQAAVKSDEYTIKINPDDLAKVTEHKPLFLASISGLKNIIFEATPSISRGGCLIESAAGKADATIESQLEEIQQHLLAALPTK